MLKNGADYRATVQFFTVSAGIESFSIHTFADFAIIAAVRKFRSVRTTPHTMDGRCRNLRRIVHYAPFPGGFFPQLIVVPDSGYAGIAIFAIQSATCNQSFHHWNNIYFLYSGKINGPCRTGGLIDPVANVIPTADRPQAKRPVRSGQVLKNLAQDRHRPDGTNSV